MAKAPVKFFDKEHQTYILIRDAEEMVLREWFGPHPGVTPIPGTGHIGTDSFFQYEGPAENPVVWFVRHFLDLNTNPPTLKEFKQEIKGEHGVTLDWEALNSGVLKIQGDAIGWIHRIKQNVTIRPPFSTIPFTYAGSDDIQVGDFVILGDPDETVFGWVKGINGTAYDILILAHKGAGGGVLQYANRAAFPATGNETQPEQYLYVAQDTREAYCFISPNTYYKITDTDLVRKDELEVSVITIINSNFDALFNVLINRIKDLEDLVNSHIQNNIRHVNSVTPRNPDLVDDERVFWNNKANATDLTSIWNEINVINLRLDSLGFGRYLATLPDETALPTDVLSEYPDARLNDYMYVEVDSQHGNDTTLYTITNLGPPTVWNYTLTVDRNITNKINRIDPFVIGDIPIIKALGELEDSGVTLAQLARQADLQTEITARSLADSALNTLITTEANTRATEDTRIEGLINTEASTRAAADAALNTRLTTVEGDLEDHIEDMDNPHDTTAQQVFDQQGTTPAVETGGIYEGSVTAANKLVTRQEFQAEISGALLYKGQIKYGANTVDDMNAISTTVPNQNLSIGDLCGVQGTSLTYRWDGVSWIAQPQNPDKTGDLYDILFWYGTWVDGNTYHGDVSAQIKCSDGATHTFDLMVLTDVLRDNEVTDPKIGNRTLVDQAGSSTLVSIAAKTLTAWLQGIRNNLKYLLATIANKVNTADFNATVDYLEAADTALGARIDDIRDKGLFIGQVATFALLPASKGANNWKVGDWMLVDHDETHAQNVALYQISAISGTGDITWTFVQQWRNTSVTMAVYRRELKVFGDYSGASAMPTNVPNESFFEIRLTEEEATIRFIATQYSASRNLMHYFMTTKQQRVMYQNVEHWWDTTASTEDSYLTGDPTHEGTRFIRNFGTNANSVLGNWYQMNDAWSILMSDQEYGEMILSFPASGNVYNIKVSDTCAAKYGTGDLNVMTPMIEIRKAFAPSVTTTLEANRIITID
jgi:hypothetical protein